MPISKMSPGVEESAMTKGEREWRKYVKATSDRYVMTEGERRWLEYRRELPCKRGAADVMPSPFANVDLLCKICTYMKDSEAVWFLSSCKELRGASTRRKACLWSKSMRSGAKRRLETG